ncbi:MAG TPA: response regulator transcription factor [Bacillales bacterium]|nr:response regulator transcription factor [Bacillales bacterium]
MSRKIMIVDQDEVAQQKLSEHLKREGFEVINVYEAGKALIQFQEEPVSLMITEYQLADMDGVTLCQQMRRQTDIPILFLSACHEEYDKIAGLSSGADDFIPKPVSSGELVARVKAHLRRQFVTQSANSGVGSNKIIFDGIEVDPDRYMVSVQGSEITLSAKEFQLLMQFAKNPGRIYQLEELYELVWGEPDFGDLRTIMVHISNLRKKIEKNPSKPAYIVTVRGAGYKFNPVVS